MGVVELPMRPLEDLCSHAERFTGVSAPSDAEVVIKTKV